MRLLSALSLLLVALCTTAAFGQSPEKPAVGQIRGALVDENSQHTRTGRAAIFLCDAESGLPIMPETRAPLDLSKRSEAPFGFDAFWHAETADDGSFEFKDVPVGKYRLVAQSWAGISGVPRGLPPDRDDPRPEPSAIIILHGVAENVAVKDGETTDAYVKQLGMEVQHILCDPEEPHNYVLVSLNPTLGDPVLGPVGWDQSFRTGIIGLTRMEVPHLTVIGLPEDREIHVSLFNYDNSAGVGGVSFVAGKQATVRLPIYAGWSNGKYAPPARLDKLTTHLEQSSVKINELLPLARDWGKAYFDYVWQHAGDQVAVPGYGQVSVVDLLAADSYRALGKSHAQRLERLRQQQKQSKSATR